MGADAVMIDLRYGRGAGCESCDAARVLQAKRVCQCPLWRPGRVVRAVSLIILAGLERGRFFWRQAVRPPPRLAMHARAFSIVCEMAPFNGVLSQASIRVQAEPLKQKPANDFAWRVRGIIPPCLPYLRECHHWHATRSRVE